MCQFFSLVSKGDGKPIYFDSVLRKKLLKDNPKNYELDSHTSIADYFGFKGAKEDSLNKYEYSPLTKVFTIDQLNTKDDSAKIKRFCKKLDFKTIVPALIIKPIIHPFKNRNRKRVTKEDLLLLKQWDSARDSVGDSVRDSVGDSVWHSVRASVRDSVGDSVWYSVGDSVWYSARDSVRAYISSFFDIKYKHDFIPCIKLWEKGIVPSFDGKVWRLHGKGGKVIKEITKTELRKVK